MEETQVAEEIETKPVEDVEAEPSAEQEAGSGEAETTNEDQGEEFEEIELDGETYRVPKKLKEAHLRWQDYTKKTMELAEQRKQAEEYAHTVRQREEFISRHVQALAQRHAIEEQYRQLEQVDLDALSQEDPIKAQQVFFRRSQLEKALQQLDGQISAQEQEYQVAQQQQLAKVRERGLEVLKREIPDWSPELGSRLAEYAVSSLGADPTFVSSILDPVLVKGLYKAYMYDQIMASQSIKEPEKVQPKPVTKVGQKATASKDPDKMSTEEWMRWRNSQLRKQRS